jgi:uncharacterized protein YjbI with pentapeptide repeats
MANPEHIAKLKEGIEAWNQWRGQLSKANAVPSRSEPGEIDLSNANLEAARLVGRKQTGGLETEYVGTRLIGINLRQANLRRANLRRADLNVADLLEADLSGATLMGADLGGADLSGANLRGADFRRAYLCGASISGAQLCGANFRRSNLRKANLSNSNLLGATFVEAELHSADLTGANLQSANFENARLNDAKLANANLCEADLHSADLSGADLAKANLSQALIGGTVFGNLDLSRSIGLENAKHSCPSSIGIDTLYRSGGKIPHKFLRGAGIPDTFIQYIASLVGTGIEFYSLFISYSTKDQDFAERLHAHLQDKGVRCWFAPHDIKGGRKIHEQIDEAVRVFDRLLLILSEASMKSEWVKTEIAHARQKEINQKRQMLFPLSLVPYTSLRQWKCFDADTGKDSAREIREYFIPDFSGWKDHDQYQKAFDQLMKGLKAEDAIRSLPHPG